MGNIIRKPAVPQRPVVTQKPIVPQKSAAVLRPTVPQKPAEVQKPVTTQATRLPTNTNKTVVPVKTHTKFGWKPQLPDLRDYAFAKIAKAVPKLPDVIDLRNKCSAVEDQGNLGSCTANALAGNLEFLEQVKTDLSRLFIYYNERVIIGTAQYDSGANLRDGIKTLVSQGVCKEAEWPYNIAKYAVRPSALCYTRAKPHTITSYYALRTKDDMLKCLASGFPFVFGFSVYSSFVSDATAKTGIVTMPKPGEQLLGGHAVMAVGYDVKKAMFLVRNSWGTGWGLKGYFWMPFAYMTPSLTGDFWTIRKQL
jgi:C1A family cysteine protease